MPKRRSVRYSRSASPPCTYLPAQCAHCLACSRIIHPHYARRRVHKREHEPRVCSLYSCNPLSWVDSFMRARRAKQVMHAFRTLYSLLHRALGALKWIFILCGFTSLQRISQYGANKKHTIFLLGLAEGNFSRHNDKPEKVNSQKIMFTWGAAIH